VLLRYVVNKEEQKKILLACHIDPTSGHVGRTSTLYRIKERFMWHGLVNDVQNMVRINYYVVDDKLIGSRITCMKTDYMFIFHIHDNKYVYCLQKYSSRNVIISMCTAFKNVALEM